MKLELRYWHSDCFLGWLKGEDGKRDACRGVIQAAVDREVLLVTSALTLAEVTKLKKRGRMNREDAQKIADFFSQDYITVRNVNRYIAEIARELAWKHRSLDPERAIHLATAVRFQITTIDTFDKKLIKLDGKIGDPPIRIGPPDIPYQHTLFDEDEPSGGLAL